MKYKTVQTMMLPDSTEENHGLIIREQKAYM